MDVREQLNAAYQNGIVLGTDTDVLTILDEAWELPCEMQSHAEQGNGPARWVMWFACCPVTGPCILACDACKERKLNTPVIGCVKDHGGCGRVFAPGSTAYRLIEPLNKAA